MNCCHNTCIMQIIVKLKLLSRVCLVTRPRSGALKIQIKHRWNGFYITVMSIVAPRMFNTVPAHLSNPPAEPPPWLGFTLLMSSEATQTWQFKHSLLLTNVFVPSEPSCRGSRRLDWTATSPDPHLLPGAATWGGTQHVNAHSNSR